MGTSTALNYANLFMDKFEAKALNIYPNQFYGSGLYMISSSFRPMDKTNWTSSYYISTTYIPQANSLMNPVQVQLTSWTPQSELMKIDIYNNNVIYIAPIP